MSLIIPDPIIEDALSSVESPGEETAVTETVSLKPFREVTVIAAWLDRLAITRTVELVIRLKSLIVNVTGVVLTSVPTVPETVTT